ncbi:MOSC domain-containing protein [Arthrobacter cryoconiti]|uniref:MOSC domain-containing protein n=1 Tax=Arthrobacter cryoconiti TaxID=748907 RepID=A0ABV8QZ31_9MICC|nr:MOSC domain-containing protein [Arthrobacter cryoconiti]MCC9069933.1 MOSC domain-containing protein [Arthrobacter cryoconiti]
MNSESGATGTVLAVCRAHRMTVTKTGFGVTAIDKRPVEEAVSVRTFGVFGDFQGDRENHGGPDQAVYAYSQEDADFWSRELGRDIPAGLFGENLRTRGIETTGAVIGQRWRVGAHLVLEVTSPRVPCATFAERMGEPQWVKRFTEVGRIGCYLRVIHKGKIQAGDAIVAESAPSHGITVGKFFSSATVEDVHTLQDLADAGELTLSAHYKKYFKRILQHAS